MKCIKCNKETKNPKFCSRSCAGSINSLGVRRHGLPPNDCIICGKKTASKDQKYCSQKCASIAKTKPTLEKQISNRIRQSKYRSKQYRKLDPTANHEKIKEIYKHCPIGCEVDHIIPLSKGGMHHENNLQYLPKQENRKKGNRW